MVSGLNILSGAGKAQVQQQDLALKKRALDQDIMLTGAKMKAEADLAQSTAIAALVKETQARLNNMAEQGAVGIGQALEGAVAIADTPEAINAVDQTHIIGVQALNANVEATARLLEKQKGLREGSLSTAEAWGLAESKLPKSRPATPGEKGVAAGVTEAAKQAQMPKATEIPPEERARLGIPEGWIAQRLPDGKIEVKQVQGAAAETPVNVRFPDGRLQAFRKNDPALDQAMREGAIEVSIQSPDVKGLTGTAEDDIRNQIGLVRNAMNELDRSVAIISQQPDRAGLAGTISRLTQTVVQAGGELAALGLDKFIGGISQRVFADVQRGIIDRTTAQGFFDPSLPAMQVLSHSMAYALARARKGDVRINEQDLELALKDVALTGATSAADVVSRLQEVRNQLAANEQNLAQRLSGQTPTPQGPPQPPPNVPVYDFIDGKLVPRLK